MSLEILEQSRLGIKCYTLWKTKIQNYLKYDLYLILIRIRNNMLFPLLNKSMQYKNKDVETCFHNICKNKEKFTRWH